MSDNSQNIEDEYILLLDSKDSEQVDYNKLKISQKVFLELNVEAELFQETTEIFLESIKDYENLQKFTLLVEGCKDFSTEHYDIIGDILNASKSQELHIEIGFENKFDDKAAESLANGISEFKNLQKFSLIVRAENQFSSAGMNSFCTHLSKQQQLNSFSIQVEDGNTLNGESLEILGKHLSESWQNLENFELQVGDKQILSAKGGKAIGDGLKNLRKLNSLKLIIGQDCQFSSEGFCELGSSLGNLKSLQTFILRIGRKNNKNSEGMVAIGKGLQQISGLKNITISIDDMNNIESKGCQEISLGLGNQKQLVQLQISFGHFNNLENEGGLFFGQNLKGLEHLTDLRVMIGAMNKLGEQGFQSFAQNIGTFKKLHTLILDINCENQIGTKGLEELGVSIGGLQQLRVIQVRVDDRNDVQIKGVITCFQNFSTLPNVKKVILDIKEVACLNYLKEKLHLDIILQENIDEQMQNQVFKGFSSLPKLKILKIVFEGQTSLNQELVQNFIKIYEEFGSELILTKFKANNSGKAKIAKLMRLFQNIIHSKNIEKAELDIVDGVRAQIDNQQAKKKGQKLLISIQPYNSCGQEGCEEISKVIKFLHKTVKIISLSIATENKIEKEGGKILVSELLACQFLTQITFQITANANKQQLQQTFTKMGTIIQKCVSNRERVIKTYLKFFQKALVDYPKKQRGGVLKHICEMLPLMKDFNLGPNQPNQGGFGQAAHIAPIVQPELFIDEDEFQEDDMEW